MIRSTDLNSQFGYHGQYLRVDLSDSSSQFVPLSDEVLRRFVGGSGLGTYLLLAENAAKQDPLSKDAVLCIAFSPLVGSPITTSAKFALVSKSPLTNRLNDSLVSSGFAIAGKKCGCDAIVIVGRSSQPSILVIDDGVVSIQSAEDVWGLSCEHAQDTLARRLGRDFRFAVIGPAGERLVRFATVSHDGRHAGRGGTGAVLGAKNLKAIAVRGTHLCEWAEPDQLVEFSKQLSKESFGPATAKYRELGTASNLLAMNRLTALPTENFRRGSFSDAEKVAPETLAIDHGQTRNSCVACTIGCEHRYAIRRGSTPNSDQSEDVRVEYENLFALGPLCGVADAETVLRASKLCDQYGLDTISTGGTIAFAMECAGRGLLNVPWLRFGDGSALLTAIHSIGNREGVGDQLAQGSRRLANEIGHDSHRFAPHVKGLEIPGYEPRALQAMGLGFAVGARGADHNRSGAYEVDFSEHSDRRNPTQDSVRMAIDTEDKAAIMDSLILCKFLRGVFQDLFADAAEMLCLVAGWETSAADLRETAQRIVNAKKTFNVRAGWQPNEDTLPERFFDEALPEDAKAQLTRDRFQSLITLYNQSRGWTDEGWQPAGQVCSLPCE